MSDFHLTIERYEENVRDRKTWPHCLVHLPPKGDTLNPQTAKRVFISSPFQELQEERKAIQRALRRMSFGIVAMEYFGSYPDAPIDRCIMLVKTADYFVMLLGDNLGTIVPGSDCTYTEAEYRAAFDNSTPILAYFRSEAPSPRVDNFREAIGRRHGYSHFSSPDDLSWKVVADIAREVAMSAPGTELGFSDPEALMFRHFEEEKKALIHRLDMRADTITALFQKRRPDSEFDVLKLFRKLHATHVEQIATSRFADAHETLRDIYNLLDTAASCYGIEDSGHMYQRIVPGPVQQLVRLNYFAKLANSPPSSPFSTIRLYDHILSEHDENCSRIPINTLSEGQ